MKALVKDKTEPGIRYCEVPDPVARSGEVIVRMSACGISGSDVARYRWTEAHHAGRAKDMTRLLPRILGNELAGTIAYIGAGVDGVAVGDAVVVQSVIGCRACESCDAGLPNHCSHRRTVGVEIDGGYAEYCVVPAANVYAVPSGVALERVALLQPFAIAAYALEIGAIQPAQRIGVWGVGAVGAALIQQAVMAGATVEFAVGRDPRRLEAARLLGARHIVSATASDAPQRLFELFADKKLDVIYELSGHTPAINSALLLLKKRGCVVLLGNLREPFQADLLPAVMEQINLLGVRTYSLNAWRRALALIPRVQGLPGALPIERVRLADGVHAFERAAAGAGVKFVLEP